MVSDSPADKAGLQRGDVIIAVNGNKIDNHQDLVFRIRQFMAGDTVNLEIVRKAEKKNISVKLTEVAPAGEESQEKGSPKTSELFKKVGVEASNVTTQLRSQYGLRSKDGVVITFVEQGSFAARAGIREGDLVLEVNGTKVSDVSDLNKAVGNKDNSLVLLLGRGGRTFFVSMSF